MIYKKANSKAPDLDHKFQLLRMLSNLGFDYEVLDSKRNHASGILDITILVKTKWYQEHD